jgi:hypothetical protein
LGSGSRDPRPNAGVARRTTVLLFLGLLGAGYWMLSSGARPSVRLFAFLLLALYLCAGAFVSSLREKGRRHP